MLSRSDELILLAVWKLQDDAYGASVLEYLQGHTQHDWSIAGVYAPLKRLARKGLLRSSTGAPTSERGGRRKRMYSLTGKGVSVLQASRREYDAMWQGLPLKWPDLSPEVSR